jgi:hypothetical protein
VLSEVARQKEITQLAPSHWSMRQSPDGKARRADTVKNILAQNPHTVGLSPLDQLQYVTDVEHMWQGQQYHGYVNPSTPEQKGKGSEAQVAMSLLEFLASAEKHPEIKLTDSANMTDAMIGKVAADYTYLKGEDGCWLLSESKPIEVPASSQYGALLAEIIELLGSVVRPLTLDEILAPTVRRQTGPTNMQMTSQPPVTCGFFKNRNTSTGAPPVTQPETTINVDFANTPSLGFGWVAPTDVPSAEKCIQYALSVNLQNSLCARGMPEFVSPADLQVYSQPASNKKMNAAIREMGANVSPRALCDVIDTIANQYNMLGVSDMYVAAVKYLIARKGQIKKIGNQVIVSM